MSKLLKLIKSLMKQGFASVDQKNEVRALYKELESTDAEAAETVKEDVEKAEGLPEEDPNKGSGDGEEELEKNIKSILRRASAAQKDEISAELKSEFKKWAESQMEAIKKQAGLFHPEVQKDAKRKAINGLLKEAFGAVVDGNTAKLKELTTDANGSPFGGYNVDRELNAEISHLVTEYGVARREFTVVPLTKHSYAKNTLAVDVVVNWAGEASSLGSTQIVLGQGSFELRKLYAIVTLTRELIEDGEIDLFAFIGTRVAEGFARKEDEAFFMGEGSGDTANGEYEGIVNVAANEVTIPVRGSLDGESIQHLTADDLLNMQDASPQWVARNGKYYMHRSIRNLVRKLKDADGNPIYQSPSENGPATIWGRPVVEVEAMPSTADDDADTAFVLYADLKMSSILGFKGGTIADMFDAGVVRNVAGNGDINLITTDRKAVRWIERVGALQVFPAAATVLKTGGGS
jgi:HK97 family phage major capsid protein